MTATATRDPHATHANQRGSDFESINEILAAPPMRALHSHLFGDVPTTVVTRPASFLIRAAEETGYVVERYIVLPPAGFTADALDLMSPHPEVRRARIIVKGAVRMGKAGFSTLRSVLAVRRGLTRDLETEANSTYARFIPGDSRHREDLMSSRDRFYAVRDNGVGFYHNLVNVSSDWIVLVVHKELSLRHDLCLDSLVEGVPTEHRAVVRELLHAATSVGDALFRAFPSLVEAAMQIEPAALVPVLLDALNVRETGRHEPCTMFGLILKLARRSPESTLRVLRPALVRCRAPAYYVDDLQRKLRLPASAAR